MVTDQVCFVSLDLLLTELCPVDEVPVKDFVLLPEYLLIFTAITSANKSLGYPGITICL
jgi:hypothetical protein